MRCLSIALAALALSIQVSSIKLRVCHSRTFLRSCETELITDGATMTANGEIVTLSWIGKGHSEKALIRLFTIPDMPSGVLKLKDATLRSADERKMKELNVTINANEIKIIVPMSKLVGVGGVGIIALGSDICDTSDPLSVIYFNNDQVAMAATCTESNAEACSEMEDTTVKIRGGRSNISLKEPFILQLVSRTPRKKGSWIYRVKGASTSSGRFEWNENDGEMQARVILYEAGRHEISVTQMFADREKARYGLNGANGEPIDEFFCGEIMEKIFVDLPSEGRCVSANVPGYWREINDTSSRLHFLPPNASPPIQEWTAVSGCRFHWFAPDEILSEFSERKWEEIIFMGDSRERSLSDSLRHILQNSTDKFSWHMSSTFSFNFGPLDVHSVNSKTGLQKDQLNGRRVWQLLEEIIFNNFNERQLCASDKKGVLFVGIPLWELRHFTSLNDPVAVTNFISSLRRRCQRHRIYFLLMPAIHDEVLMNKLPDQISTWIQFQNQDTMLDVNSMIVALSKSEEFEIIDLYEPTASRPDASFDGVHYIRHCMWEANSTAVVDGSNVSHVLMQLILNSVFPAEKRDELQEIDSRFDID